MALTPLDETGHARLIRLYGRAGRRGLAEAHYARCAKLLREELGQDPGDEIRAALAEARRPSAKPQSAAPEPEAGWRAAIAVLPFANLAGDERWNRLADGISEDTITDLARHSDLTVIARSSSFAFRDRHVDAREIGRELGVRYLLEGSIQAAGGRMRVTAQLIDAQTRAHLGAERYERDEGDLFVVQDDVVQQVAGALLGWEGRISRAERRRAQRGRHRAWRRTSAIYWRMKQNPSSRVRTPCGRSSWRKAPWRSTRRSPGPGWCAPMHWTTSCCLAGRRTRKPPKRVYEAYEQSILRAHELDPADGTILIEIGDLRAKAGDLAGARAAYEEAARVAANHGDTLALLAKYFVGALGRPEEAQAMMQRAFRFNPGTPPMYFYNQLRVAYLLGDFQDAVAAARHSPDTALTKLFLAMSLARLGCDAETEEVVRALRRDHPAFDPMSVCEYPWLLDARAQTAVREGLRSIKLLPCCQRPLE